MLVTSPGCWFSLVLSCRAKCAIHRSAEAEVEGVLDGSPGLLKGLWHAQSGKREPEEAKRDDPDAHSDERQKADVLRDRETVRCRRRDEIELCRADRVKRAPAVAGASICQSFSCCRCLVDTLP